MIENEFIIKMNKYLFLIIILFSLNTSANESIYNPFLSKNTLSLQLHSLSFSTRDDEKNADFSINFESVGNDKIVFSASLNNAFSESKDSFDKSKTETNKTDLEINYEINNLWGHFGFDSYMTYSNERENEVYITKHNLEIAPVGLKYLAYQSYPTLFSISYHPTYSYFEAEDSDTDISGAVTYSSFKATSLLHLIHLSFETIMLESIASRVDLKWKTAEQISSNNALNRENTTSMQINLSHQLNDNLSFGYYYIIDKDHLRQTFQELQDINEKHSLYLQFLLK